MSTGFPQLGHLDFVEPPNSAIAKSPRKIAAIIPIISPNITSNNPTESSFLLMTFCHYACSRCLRLIRISLILQYLRFPFRLLVYFIQPIRYFLMFSLIFLLEPPFFVSKTLAFLGLCLCASLHSSLTMLEPEDFILHKHSCSNRQLVYIIPPI